MHELWSYQQIRAAMLKSSFAFKLFLIEIAFDFSKFDLMLQIQQMTIFSFYNL